MLACFHISTHLMPILTCFCSIFHNFAVCFGAIFRIFTVLLPCFIPIANMPCFGCFRHIFAVHSPCSLFLTVQAGPRIFLKYGGSCPTPLKFYNSVYFVTEIALGARKTPLLAKNIRSAPRPP